jgi:hypothetical protein
MSATATRTTKLHHGSYPPPVHSGLVLESGPFYFCGEDAIHAYVCNRAWTRGEFTTIDQIAFRFGRRPRWIRQVVGLLVSRGLVKVHRGRVVEPCDFGPWAPWKGGV